MDSAVLRIRETQAGDLPALLALYTHLHEARIPSISPELDALWAAILADANHHLLLGFWGEELVSSCVLLVVPNLTRGPRPYALVENVVTHADFRGRGFASAMLNHARELARVANCYKIMLMTGSKMEETLRFYERAGYNRHDKTAFIQWLD
ncbi:MAG: GNAT family N-acetyltransferase [Christensenellaceae bacterium]|jgi:GNAT superfamily N-acetyltransferase|nr:GNAT family N-acetyltransferase [Christensenellaceae bacterium]